MFLSKTQTIYQMILSKKKQKKAKFTMPTARDTLCTTVEFYLKNINIFEIVKKIWKIYLITLLRPHVFEKNEI